VPRLYLSSGVVVEDAERAWPCSEDDSVELGQARPGMPVVVGPREAPARAIERARSEARRLVAVGGAIAAAAGVDLGGGFRSGRLAGAADSRRDALLAAVEFVRSEGLERLGPRDAVLVALFGSAATKRVGALAVEAVRDGAFSALRLAAAASDVVGAEKVEVLLRLRAPIGCTPVPAYPSAILAEHIAAVVGRFPERRRLTLLLSLWDGVVGWQRSEQARALARRRRVSKSRLESWKREIAGVEHHWWRAKAAPAIGYEPGPHAMLTWTPDAGRRVVECGAAAGVPGLDCCDDAVAHRDGSGTQLAGSRRR
jgi:hypothetical protein